MNNPISLPSQWAPIDIHSEELPESAWITVPPEDPDLCEFVGAGCFRLAPNTLEGAKFIGMYLDKHLESALMTRFACLPKQVSSASRAEQAKVTVYSGLICRLSNSSSLAVLASLNPFPERLLAPREVREQALRLWERAKQEKVAADAEEEKIKEGDRECFSQMNPGIVDYMAGQRGRERKVESPSFCPLLPSLPEAILSENEGLSGGNHADSLASSIESLGMLVSEAEEDVLITSDANGSSKAMMIIKGDDKRTSYAEIRAAVESSLPNAFRHPRLSDVNAPNLPIPPTAIVQVDAGSGGIPSDPGHHLSDVIRGKANEGRERLEEQGFEAFGWYQPFHAYDEPRWGIYLHAERLEGLASVLLEDWEKAANTAIDPSLTVDLAVKSVLYHEQFHARVEAVITLNELTSLEPRFRRYKDQVYRPTFGTPECLEEALANWWSLRRLEEDLGQLAASGTIANTTLVRGILETNLDLSPPGYREWRLGKKDLTWRRLADAMVVGRLTQSGQRPLPCESILRDPLPFDFDPEAVPTYVVGEGAFADAILASYAIFGLPERRELIKALEYLGYRLVPVQGKGSHEKWRGHDGRSFPVPDSKVVSRKVFRSFLRHFGISKYEYVLRIRPDLS